MKRAFCNYYDMYLSDIPDYGIDNCDYMPEECACVYCAYYTMIEFYEEDFYVD